MILEVLRGLSMLYFYRWCEIRTVAVVWNVAQLSLADTCPGSPVLKAVIPVIGAGGLLINVKFYGAYASVIDLNETGSLSFNRI